MSGADAVERTTITVLGGTGFVGASLARRWRHTPACSLRYVVHRSNPDWLHALDVETRPADLNDPNSVVEAVGNSRAIINLLRPDGTGWYPPLLERLATAISRGTRRCVHASSIDVYRGSAATQIDHDTPPVPLAAYEREHLAVERIFGAAFQETVVMRIGAAFGPGGRNVVALAREMQRAPEWKLALRRSLYGKRRMHLVSVETVADALAAAAMGPSPPARHLAIVTEDAAEENNFAYVQDSLAAAFGRRSPNRLPEMPAVVLRALLRIRGIHGSSAVRRFPGGQDSTFGFGSADFARRLDIYAAYLAAEARAEPA